METIIELIKSAFSVFSFLTVASSVLFILSPNRIREFTCMVLFTLFLVTAILGASVIICKIALAFT